MMNDGSRIQYPPRPAPNTSENPVSEKSFQGTPTQTSETPNPKPTIEEAIQKNQDRYGMSLINKVMQGLRSVMLQRSGDTAQTRASSRAQLGQELSLFEKVFLAHFESGAVVGNALPPGLEKFLKKGVQEWSGFFNNLTPFTQKKILPMAEIQTLLFRGVIQTSKEGKNLTWLVADIQLPAQKGRLQPTWEKFARILVSGESAAESALLQKTLSLLQKNPGEALPLSEFAELLPQKNGGLECETLSYKIVDSNAITAENKVIAESYQSPEQVRMASMREGTRQSTPGIALDARTEALMASQHLQGHSSGTFPGNLPASLRSSADMQKKKEARDEERLNEKASSQLPPFLLNPSKYRMPTFRGKPRWYIVFFYSILGIVSIVACYSIVRHFL